MLIQFLVPRQKKTERTRKASVMAAGQSEARPGPLGYREPALTLALSRGERENRRQPAGEARVAAAVTEASRATAARGEVGL
jgi:hypothetical protein